MIGRALLFLLPFAVAAVPVFELEGPWFDVDFVQGPTNGVRVCDHAEGRTLEPIQPLAAATPAGIQARVRYADDDIPAARHLPDLSSRGVQAALTVAQRADGAFAFYGWTAQGWVELAGATPRLDADIDIRADVDASVSPATVRFAADGVALVAALDGTTRVFPAGGASGARIAAVDLEGAGEALSVAGERAFMERVAAVVRGDQVAYYPDVASARRASTVDGAVTLLRPATISVADLSGMLKVHGTALSGDRPALTVAGDAAAWARAKPLIELPAGFAGEGALLAPATDAALAALHVHGDAGMACTVFPREGVLQVREEPVPLDTGGFVAFWTVPEGARTFLRGLGEMPCGSENAFYVNGRGELVLCQTNAFTGKLVVEGDPRLVTCFADDFSRALRFFVR